MLALVHEPTALASSGEARNLPVIPALSSTRAETVALTLRLGPEISTRSPTFKPVEAKAATCEASRDSTEPSTIPGS